ncbi:MAG: sigma-70 family RNA polymerase sigma factor [Acidobacteria bacterium]|nr:sigma-70 family RNA polymerase sigma factor [Acidobacteriota bacterium]MBI3421568.1 sigma-70 family RNA polymerase sigma factor [Acidobacteriota bacterium]
MTEPSAHSLSSRSDEDLLRLTLDGDEQAFDLLYERRAGAVYQFALRMSGSNALAEDVAQDVFMALIRRGQLFDPARGTVIKYLLGMTRNRVLTLLQREQSFIPLVEEGEEESALANQAADVADPLLELARHERIEAVRQAILALPLHYREVVALCNLDEMSYEQAASVIGCPVGTVRSRLNRARALLVEKLNAVRVVRAVQEAVPPVAIAV